MSQIDDFLNRFPPEVQGSVRAVWNALETNEKNRLIDLLGSFPHETNLIKGLTKQATAQVRQAFGRKSRVAIIGPANVGKSTLYNQMVNHKDDKAAVGPLPGLTRENQEADAGLFQVVDTPGADAVGAVGEHERELAFTAAGQADFLILVYDAIQGVKKTEQELFNDLRALNKPFVVVINKVDMVSNRDLEGVIAHAAGSLGLSKEQIIPVSAKDGKNLADVMLAVAAAEPEMVAALGAALPQYRWKLAWRSIVSAASLSGTIALTPLPVIDFIPLVVTQSVMVLGIARIYGYKITPQRARELVAAFGLGFLGRTLFQELSKFGGIPGWLLSAAIAASTTVVMGYAAVRWFEKGEKLSGEALKKLTEEMTANLLKALKDIGKKGKPGRKTLEDTITSSLEGSPLSESSKPLDDEIDNTSK